MASRMIVYIDGFNLYYGALKNTTHKWLDLQSLAEQLFPDDTVVKVKYFTALMAGERLQRQKPLLKALRTRPKIETVFGKLKRRDRKCKVRNCRHTGSRKYQDWEEKRTDVNIAVHMLDDAHQNNTDKFALISGDTDLIPPIELIKQNWPTKRVYVYEPSHRKERGKKSELRHSADRLKKLPHGLLRSCQLPNPVALPDGTKILKPESW